MLERRSPGKEWPERRPQVLAKNRRHVPRHARAQYLLALVWLPSVLDEALSHYRTATSLQPGIDTPPELHFLFSVEYGKLGQFKEALQSAGKGGAPGFGAGQNGPGDG